MSTGSLTPAHRSQEVVNDATNEGLINGILSFIPSLSIVTLLVRNNISFAKRTNFQSRTALVIMPPLFIAALTSEMKLSHRMKQVANETQHTNETVQWAEQQMKQLQQEQHNNSAPLSGISETQHLAALYQQSVSSSGVTIVPKLYWYHHIANYTANYPFRVLAAVAIPSVGYIFYGRTEQTHLQLSQKIMHTRVFGQFTTIALLLSVMGFKEYMDHHGLYISEQQSNDRVMEMQYARQQFLLQLELEKKHDAELQEALTLAHEEDNNNDHSTTMTTTKKKKNKKQQLLQSAVAQPSMTGNHDITE